MKRWLYVALLVVLTIGFIVGFFLLSLRSIQPEEASVIDCGQPVIVSKVDIPPGTTLNSLIVAGDFTTECMPSQLVVEGAATAMNELENQTTTAAIYANEQIPLMRLDIG